MKKRIKRLFNKQGFTLVEVLVVLIITSVLLLCATGMLTPVNRLLNTTKADAHLDAASNTINEYIRGTIQKAKYISIAPVGSASLTACQTYIGSDTTLKINALAVLKSNDPTNDPNENYRLYSFENVSDVSVFSSPSDENNGVFNPAYYENASYVLTFSKQDQPGAANPSAYTSSSYMKINSIFLRKDSPTSNGTPTSQEKSLSFKMLDGSVNFGGNTSGSYKNVSGDYDLTAYGDGIVILYVVKDIESYYNSLPNPSP